MDFAPIMGPEKYGISTDLPAANVPTALASTVAPSQQSQDAGKLLSLENPFTVFAGVAAVTFGLMAFSTSVRVGNSSASLNLGKA